MVGDTRHILILLVRAIVLAMLAVNFYYRGDVPPPGGVSL